jgi:hypothetical protein
MYRNLIRASVGLLTFGVGVIASSFFYHQVKVVHVVQQGSILVVAPVSTVRSPIMSIESLPTDPIKILYVGTEISADRKEGRRVNFLLQNVSNGAIRAYVVSCLRSRATSSGAAYQESRSFQEGFRYGSSQSFVCYSEATDTLELSVNEVEFMDGIRWSKSQTLH